MSAIKIFINGIFLFAFFTFIGYVTTNFVVLFGLQGAKIIVDAANTSLMYQSLTPMIYENANSWLKMMVLFGKYSPWIGFISMIVYWVVASIKYASREVLYG